MKKILLLLLLSMPVISIAQNNKLSNEEMASQINFSPTEFSNSVVLELNFEGAQEMTYKVFKGSALVKEQSIDKGQSATVKKFDFSTLTTGPYIVKVFVAETEIKQFSIAKL
ncbi:MAG: hypothetical protein AAF489_17160 [Bacteroidota bacterium]